MLGAGLIKGLVETARNFLGSYVGKERLTTVQFPEEREPRIEASRNFPFLVYDGTDPMAGLRCVSCFICEKECPPKCIIIDKSTDKKPDATGKPQFYPNQFKIDVSVCMSCQICVEVCPFDAIKMDNSFEHSATERFDELLWDKHRLAKPNEYYHEIHPTEAAAVDAELAAARAKAAAPKPAAPAAAAAPAAPKPAVPPPAPVATAAPAVAATEVPAAPIAAATATPDKEGANEK
jgi:NADH-quinone oxidoreductase subunit I